MEVDQDGGRGGENGKKKEKWKWDLTKVGGDESDVEVIRFAKKGAREREEKSRE